MDGTSSIPQVAPAFYPTSNWVTASQLYGRATFDLLRQRVLMAS